MGITLHPKQRSTKKVTFLLKPETNPAFDDTIACSDSSSSGGNGGVAISSLVQLSPTSPTTRPLLKGSASARLQAWGQSSWGNTSWGSTKSNDSGNSRNNNSWGQSSYSSMDWSDSLSSSSEEEEQEVQQQQLVDNGNKVVLNNEKHYLGKKHSSVVALLEKISLEDSIRTLETLDETLATDDGYNTIHLSPMNNTLPPTPCQGLAQFMVNTRDFSTVWVNSPSSARPHLELNITPQTPKAASFRAKSTPRLSYKHTWCY